VAQPVRSRSSNRLRAGKPGSYKVKTVRTGGTIVGCLFPADPSTPSGDLKEAREVPSWLRRASRLSLSARRRRCRLSWLDVVVHAEEIFRVVLVLQFDQTVVIGAIGCARERISLI